MATSTTPAPEQGIWNQQKTRLKLKFPTLTDADLDYQEGQKDVMFSRLQAKLGKTRSEIDAVILSRIIY